MAKKKNVMCTFKTNKCKEIYYNVDYIIAMVLLTGLYLSITLGWNTYGDMLMHSEVGIDGKNADKIVAMVLVGAFFGSLLVPVFYLCNKYLLHNLRLMQCQLVAPFIILVAAAILIQLACSRNTGITYSELVLIRLLHGLGIGCLYVALHFNIAELTRGDSRNEVLVSFHGFNGLGYVLLHANQENNKSILSSLCISNINLIICALTLITPLSHLLHVSNKQDESPEVLQQLTQELDSSTSPSVDKTRELVKALGRPSWNRILEALCHPKCLRSFVVATSIMVCQQLSGAHVINFNSLMLFDYIVGGTVASYKLCIWTGFAQVVGAVMAALLIRYIGRRGLLIISSILMSVFLCLVGLFLALSYDEQISPLLDNKYPIATSVCIVLYFFAYNFGMGPVPWSILSDSFPAEARIFAAPLVAALGWLAAIPLHYWNEKLFDYLTMPGIMGLFFAFSLMATFISCFFVRETYGKSLADLQHEFWND